MIKYYCDNCGKEIVDDENIEVKEGQILHYCDECQYNALTCEFKVGDQVITDDGRVGIIESFCTCPSCKIRGFYEPEVKMEIGDDPIWITDNDKNNGFKNFYKIGEQIFGNLDEQYVHDQVYNRKKELITLEAQLNVLNTLKEEKKL